MPTKIPTELELSATKHMSSREAAKFLGVGKTTINKYRRVFGIAKSDGGIIDPVLPSKPSDEPDIRKPRILALDLETSPNVAHVWGLWQQNVSIKQLLDSTEVICFGARWLGESEVMVYSVHVDGKKAMLEAAHKLLDEADAMMGWNSKGFDMKHLNREFIENGMLPPSPTVQLDLMLEVKKKFRFPSNKLDYVSQALGFEGKVQHRGHQLWIDCLAGNEAAWKEMYEYQKQDVDLLIDLYAVLLPWLSGHPNAALFAGLAKACVNCGSVHLQSRGEQFTGTGVYQRYQCTDCGKWQKSFKRSSTTEMRGI